MNTKISRIQQGKMKALNKKLSSMQDRKIQLKMKKVNQNRPRNDKENKIGKHSRNGAGRTGKE